MGVYGISYDAEEVAAGIADDVAVTTPRLEEADPSILEDIFGIVGSDPARPHKRTKVNHRTRGDSIVELEKIVLARSMKKLAVVLFASGAGLDLEPFRVMLKCGTRAGFATHGGGTPMWLLTRKSNWHHDAELSL
jgi:hypothetical protein